MKELFAYDRLIRILGNREDAKGALFHIDIGNFKVIDDIYGQDLSNRVMDKVLDKLKRIEMENFCPIRNTYRLTDSELLIFYPNTRDNTMVYSIANKILDEFDSPIQHDDNRIYISLSMGISLYPEHGSNIKRLIECARLALRRAKDSSKNSFQLYEFGMSKDNAAANTLKENLREAVKGNQFILHYHPQVDMMSKEVVSFEVLTRWNHPQQGLIYPNDFIHIAEESRFIIPMGDVIFRTACKQLKQWHDSGLPRYSISVNISPIQLQQRHFVEKMRDIIYDTGLDPSYIEMEITEDSLIRYMNQAVEVLNEMHEMGIKISLDDFGTGYSSLNYLHKLPIDIIKIDKTFVDNIEDEVERAIVKAIIVMGHDIGLCITAEGVETESQFEILEGLGCDRVQGFLFGKPSTNTQIEQKIGILDQQIRAL